MKVSLRCVLFAVTLLASLPARAQPENSIYAKLGSASAMFDLCGMPQLGERVRAALLALADECRLGDPAREAHGQAVEQALAAAQKAAATPEAIACRDRLYYDQSLPAMMDRLTAFEAGKAPASRALSLTCERLDQPPGRAP